MDMGQQSQQEMAPTSSNSYNDGMERFSIYPTT
jgi:hypothetical protein